MGSTSKEENMHKPYGDIMSLISTALAWLTFDTRYFSRFCVAYKTIEPSDV